MSDLSQAPFGALRRFVRRPSAVETCELCSRELATNHQHLFEPVARKLVCSCDACALLFPVAQAGADLGPPTQLRYKRVPRRIRYIPDFRLSDSQWNSLMLPINMAFFFKSSPQDRVAALYPSPAGATESMLSLDTWKEIESENPPLAEMEDDVEALLVNRIGHSRGFTEPEYYMVPIDECFKLTGLIRTQWRGLSGGTEVWREIAEFFGGLKARSPRVAEPFHA